MAHFTHYQTGMVHPPGAIIFLCLLFLGFCSGCAKIETCYRDYNLGLEAAGITVNESSPTFCAELKAYSNCLRKALKECRGNLSYHTSTTYIDLFMKRFKCSQYVHLSVPTKRLSTTRQKPPLVCTYTPSGPMSYQHCGFFGDPHLKTFSGNYETCRTLGAWPLIVNKYLAVQVTNLHVVNSSNASAIMKLTVIIKQMGNCALEKTYEATADAPLKPYFIDGSSKAGPEGSVTIKATKSDGNEKIKIYIRYIDATLILRRVGDYLAFSSRMPKEIVDLSEEEGFDLCRKGCPSNELLNIKTSIKHSSLWESAYANCTNNGGAEEGTGNADIKNTLTDYYLDWCIFDVMTSGENIFVAAAHSAQADVLELDPGSLNNRTVPLWLKKSDTPNGGSTLLFLNSYSLILIFYFVMEVINR
ncbi:repulsive guidance molecule A-like [Cimex lectularius]|uniref:RGM domain family member B n=1 Tax=Cimex lectularius TaxID=79782 RepID=A0A8I6SEJ4_CIMLE|nr:repulsive guidance molecule A-like [Cimex lectularius]XP_014253641.1 repulsive guidance molecule A-like [Cimex lectularius]XP_024081190.1 repulsive guidance molecule A-like [Cimex lectularius]XP_024081191.1 repulsive guidance molecule A-like [Cimex lectularius]XP_024081192.1 repulsive guidance molecule A-like [Cimex lectularius]XP_024081193.1 repulsive guidance molecule A-like [Cimex lectularius]